MDEIDPYANQFSGDPQIHEAQRFQVKVIDFETGFNQARLRLLQGTIKAADSDERPESS